MHSGDGILPLSPLIPPNPLPTSSFGRRFENGNIMEIGKRCVDVTQVDLSKLIPRDENKALLVDTPPPEEIHGDEILPLPLPVVPLQPHGSSSSKATDNTKHYGDFAFKETWFHLYDEYLVKYEADHLPPSIVCDLNSDEKKEVHTAINDAKIQVLEPHSKRVIEGFSEARVLADISLLPDKIRVTSGRRAVAMGTSVIDRYFKDGTP